MQLKADHQFVNVVQDIVHHLVCLDKVSLNSSMKINVFVEMMIIEKAMIIDDIEVQNVIVIVYFELT